MDQDHNRIEEEYVTKIRRALSDKKLVIIVGAGISLNAIRPPPSRITWIGLIENGLEFLEKKKFVAADDDELIHYRRILRKNNTNLRTVLRACAYLKDELDVHEQFPTWLESVFGSLHRYVTNPKVLEVLRRFHQNGAKLMTTNYDDLLERHCNLQRVRRLIPEDIRKYEQGTLDGIFHIHGSFHDPGEVVLDPIAYYQITTSDDVQNLLQTYLGHNTILFVGCGSGLEDPNFSNLLKWASKREKNIPNHHYILAQEEDNLNYSPLITLEYGRSYQDLVPYLTWLLDDPANALIIDNSTKKDTFAKNVSGM